MKEISRDNDCLYRWFKDIVASRGVNVKRLAFQAPDTNAFIERFIQSLQAERLDHLLVFSEKHLDYLVREYGEHYHTERPHQRLGNRTVAEAGQCEEEPRCTPLGKVRRRTRLGGVLSHYVREAA